MLKAGSGREEEYLLPQEIPRRRSQPNETVHRIGLWMEEFSVCGVE